MDFYVKIHWPIQHKLPPWVNWNYTPTLCTRASSACIKAITPQGMLGNLVKDVRSVNHLQSVVLSHWSILPPPGELYWSRIQQTVSVCCCTAAAQQETTGNRRSLGCGMWVKTKPGKPDDWTSLCDSLRWFVWNCCLHSRVLHASMWNCFIKLILRRSTSFHPD